MARPSSSPCRSSELRPGATTRHSPPSARRSIRRRASPPGSPRSSLPSSAPIRLGQPGLGAQRRPGIPLGGAARPGRRLPLRLRSPPAGARREPRPTAADRPGRPDLRRTVDLGGDRRATDRLEVVGSATARRRIGGNRGRAGERPRRPRHDPDAGAGPGAARGNPRASLRAPAGLQRLRWPRPPARPRVGAGRRRAGALRPGRRYPARGASETAGAPPDRDASRSAPRATSSIVRRATATGYCAPRPGTRSSQESAASTRPSG